MLAADHVADPVLDVAVISVGPNLCLGLPGCLLDLSRLWAGIFLLFVTGSINPVRINQTVVADVWMGLNGS